MVFSLAIMPFELLSPRSSVPTRYRVARAHLQLEPQSPIPPQRLLAAEGLLAGASWNGTCIRLRPHLWNVNCPGKVPSVFRQRMAFLKPILLPEGFARILV
jgi:hypothetical protein